MGLLTGVEGTSGRRGTGTHGLIHKPGRLVGRVEYIIVYGEPLPRGTGFGLDPGLRVSLHSMTGWWEGLVSGVPGRLPRRT